MTTNSQNLTFGEWLAARGISPDRFEALDPTWQAIYRDEWRAGPTPAPWEPARSKP